MYTFQFFLLCLSSFLFFTSFNMIIPELPAYLDRLGGGQYKGLIIALFTLTAGLSRPFSGKLTDTVGRVPVMIFGAVVCCVCGFIYPLATSVTAFLALRFFHGLSTGFKPTGTSAYVADLVPNHRRGEAMGILGLSGSLGIAAGPAIGSAIANAYSFDTMFYASSAAAVLSVLVLVGMKETLVERQPFSLALFRLSPREILEPRVVAPCVVVVLTTFSFGIVLTLTPDLSDSLGIANRGLYFLYFTGASVAVRVLAGKASDRYGRIAVLRVATLTLMVGMLLTGWATTVPMFIAGGVVFGLGAGMNTPTVFAWTIDLSRDRYRGRAMATMYIALEFGIGMGALLSGWIYGNDDTRFGYAYGLGALLVLVGWLYLLIGAKRMTPPVEVG
ncbi:MAG: MFS transporter [Tunicatimonas sp.]